MMTKKTTAKTHMCNKETEIATMTEKINNIERDVCEIKHELKSLPDRLEKRYATKEEVNNIKQGLYENREGLKDNATKIWDLAQKVATIGATIALFWLIIRGGSI